MSHILQYQVSRRRRISFHHSLRIRVYFIINELPTFCQRRGPLSDQCPATQATERLVRHSLCSSTMLTSNYKYYCEVLSRIKRPIFSITTNQDNDGSALSLESYTLYGLGSTVDGHVISKVSCSNTSSRRIGWVVCPNDGLLACSQVWIALAD